MKGQTAFEYLMMFSIVLTILTFLTYYAQSMTESNREDIIDSNVVIAVNKITEAADIVYTQGSPSQITLSVYIPENLQSIQFSNKMIDIKVKVGSGISDIVASSKASFTVDSLISLDSGTKKIKVAAVNVNGESYVNVTQS